MRTRPCICCCAAGFCLFLCITHYCPKMLCACTRLCAINTFPSNFSPDKTQPTEIPYIHTYIHVCVCTHTHTYIYTHAKRTEYSASFGWSRVRYGEILIILGMLQMSCKQIKKLGKTPFPGSFEMAYCCQRSTASYLLMSNWLWFADFRPWHNCVMCGFFLMLAW